MKSLNIKDNVNKLNCNNSDNKIKILDKYLVSQIAAGEVIQNACNVIKELIENAIDVNSTEIEIIIENGGKTLIKVIDNGYGMSMDDLKICVENHATSKFTNLDNINTLGFRGEALYSIAHSSELSIISKKPENPLGYLLNHNCDIEPCASNDGTTVIVKNLLYKIPARQKFLKSDSQEGNLIENMIRTYQLGYPNINFIFKNNEKTILLPNKINTNERTINISFTQSEYELSGTLFIEYKHIYIFVNHRPIQNKRFVAILKEIYRGITGNDRIGMLLRINCPSNLIDVNMHPAKIEIRFLENIIYDIFNVAVRNAFEVPLNINNNINNNNINHNNINHNHINDNYINQTFNNKININDDKINNNEKNNHWFTASCFGKNNFSILNQKQDSFINLNDDNKKDDLMNDWQNICGVLSEFNVDNKRNHNDCNIPQVQFGEIIGQIFNKYIICELEDDLILIDQHAASERIWAEKLKTEKIQLQQLINPIKLIIDNNQEDKIWKLSEIMEISLIDKTLIIKAIPIFISEDDIVNSIKNFLQNDSNDPMWIVHEVLHERGCKSAIKSGQSMTNEEAISLLKTLQNTSNGQFCNHGRPTFIKINIKEIDKRFLRT